MSNPIKDTTEVVKEMENKPAKLDLNFISAHEPNADLFSPESPQNRRPIHVEFDPKVQWQKVLKRLTHRDSASIDSSISYELNPLPALNYNDQDDILPDTTEIINTVEPVELEEKDFFQQPFDECPSVTDGQTLVVEEEQDRQTRARKHWGKTLEKVKLIANLHSLPQSKKTSTATSQLALIPFFPPLFDPIFLSFSKAKHGHVWVAVTDSEPVTQGLHQWVFRIELQYGDIRWVIHRTIADFVQLHYTLKLKALTDGQPSPPSFPSQFDSWRTSTSALRRRQDLTLYLQQLTRRADPAVIVCDFLEISGFSSEMGWKGKEGYLDSKVAFVVPRLCQILRPHTWKKQWVVLRDSYVGFLKGEGRVVDVFLFDKSLRVMRAGGKYHHHVVLANGFRRIEMKGSRREVEEWQTSMERVLKGSPWVKNHRFGSFAPIRHQAKLRWYVDGEDHFEAVAEALMEAKSEIYIADWWLSPELYLKRPPAKHQEYRLDRLLKRKAEEGVMIYIIIYKEMTVALTIHSAHTKTWLQNLHKNIIVVRHPDHRSIDNNVLFWSHHEKIVVVDNRIAFIGGLDLCWGRYDTKEHRLTDYPSEGHPDENFPGQDYSNPRVKDFMNVAQHDATLVNRETTARMPWHDMTVSMVGPIARDVARHFIQRWNFLKASKGMHRPTVPFLMPKGEYVAARDESQFKGSCRVQLLRSSAQWSSGIEREHSIYNAYMECISKSKHYIYIENQFFISTTTEDRLLRNKIAQAIVERIKKAHAKGERFRIIVLMPLIPAFEGDLATKDAAAARNVMHFQYMTICRGGNSIQEKLVEAGIEPDRYIRWFSLRTWDRLVPANRTKEKTIWNDDRTSYVSELVYIHDKIMIVDDQLVLIGSANINDRSQLGNRDSEIAMLIEDTETVDTMMDGKRFKAAKFAYTLRQRLFKEHLGLLEEGDEELDPLSDEFFERWCQIAHENTLVYRELFRCVPDDTVHTFEQHRKFLPDPVKIPHGHVADPELHGQYIQQRLSRVKGHLVEFPTHYLKNENMLGSLIRETVTPMVIFT